MNGGKGLLEIEQDGLGDIIFHKFENEHISISKPTILAKNLIWGGLLLDIGGFMKAINNQTKETIVIKFIEKVSDKQNSRIEGSIYNRSGAKVGELIGSWLDQISYKDLVSGTVSCLWKEQPLTKNAAMQYYFSDLSLILNYKSEQMKGVIAPTDSRWRSDLRLYEEGDLDESENQKVIIENR